MKLIHTADWHLGQSFHGRERHFEQRRFLDWLLETLSARRPDALLIAGDIFDVVNPSLAAQQLLYDFLVSAHERLPQLDIVMIAGNHDSGARIELPAPLLARLNVHALGRIHYRHDGEPDGDRLASLEETLTALAALPAADADSPARETWPWLEVRVSLDSPCVDLRARIERALAGRAVRLVSLSARLQRSEEGPSTATTRETPAPAELFAHSWRQRFDEEAQRDSSAPDVAGETLTTADPRTLLRRGETSGYASVDFRGCDGHDYRAIWQVRRARKQAAGRLQSAEQRLLSLPDETLITDRKREYNQLLPQRLGLTFDQLNIETLFIDEGFGSLDPHSLAQAMDALDALQSQGRRVGVISHVQEMQERIATRSDVAPCGNGQSEIRVLRC